MSLQPSTAVERLGFAIDGWFRNAGDISLGNSPGRGEPSFAIGRIAKPIANLGRAPVLSSDRTLQGTARLSRSLGSRASALTWGCGASEGSLGSRAGLLAPPTATE